MGRGQEKVGSRYTLTAFYRLESLCMNTQMSSTRKNEGGWASLKSPFPLRAYVGLQETLEDNRKLISSRR